MAGRDRIRFETSLAIDKSGMSVPAQLRTCFNKVIQLFHPPPSRSWGFPSTVNIHEYIKLPGHGWRPVQIVENGECDR